jgi:hypothetical protein
MPTPTPHHPLGASFGKRNDIFPCIREALTSQNFCYGALQKREGGANLNRLYVCVNRAEPHGSARRHAVRICTSSVLRVVYAWESRNHPHVQTMAGPVITESMQSCNVSVRQSPSWRTPLLLHVTCDIKSLSDLPDTWICQICWMQSASYKTSLRTSSPNCVLTLSIQLHGILLLVPYLTPHVSAPCEL